MKTVSVVIPTYNRKQELFRSIQTVLDQTYNGKIELVIIDDSKESLKQSIQKEFSQQLKNKSHRTITYIHKAKKEGAPLARNIGIQKATGEFIAFLDDDDEWMPDKTEKQVAFLDQDPQMGLVICYSIDKRFDQERVNKIPQTVSHEHILKAFNLSSSSSYLVRKDVLEDLNGFDITLPSAQEYDLAIRLSERYRVQCVPEVLMIQNATKGQISENWNRKIKGILALYSKHHHRYRHLGFKGMMMNHAKTIGLLKLFFLGHFVGNRIYSLLTPMKEVYEQ